MNPAIYVALQEQERQTMFTYLLIKRKGGKTMSIEAFQKNIGNDCRITNLRGEHLDGRIIQVEGNWVELETKKHTEYVNAEYVEKFRISR